MKEKVLFSIIPLVAYYIVMLLTGNTVANKYFNREDKIALVFGVTMRNLTIALALSLATVGGGMAVFLIAIGYIVQVPLAAFYVKHLNREYRTS
jgi:predicted Na+-dependent transporter